MRYLLFLIFVLLISLSLATSFVSNCTEVSKPGDYVLIKDLQFTKTPRVPWNPGDVCLRISSSNVNLDCNGHSITGFNENRTRGVSFNQVQNVSIENCLISSFDLSIGLDESLNVLISGNSLFSNVYLQDSNHYSSSQVSITNNVFTNSSLSGWERYHNLTITNNTFIDGGIYVALDSNSLISNNVILENDYFCSYVSSLKTGNVVSNNSFSSSCQFYIEGEGLLFTNNSISSNSSRNGLDISRLKNSQIINNTICSSNLNRSTSYTNEYFDIYNSGIATNITYINNTCDTSNPKHLCTKSCKGSDVLSKSNCPFSFILIGFIFLAFLRGKNQ